MSVPSKEVGDLLAKLGGGGWAALDPASPENQQARKDNALQRFQKAHEIAAPFMTPAGIKALAALKAQTIGIEAWQVHSLGLVNAIGFGIYREGQNSIVRFIEQQIEIAEQGPEGTAPAKKRGRA